MMRGQGSIIPQAGVYTLLIQLGVDINLAVGRLGEHPFAEGSYAYTGSALGLGNSGLRERIARHLQREKNRFWHIDYLMALKDAFVVAVIAAATSKKMECMLNRNFRNHIPTRIPVLGFGASDCKEGCGSHLLHFPRIMKKRLVEEVAECYCRLGLRPLILRLGDI